MSTRAEDLAELGLQDNVRIDERVIRKAYLKLSRSRHPDKPGGRKEDFQRLVNAYERLCHADESNSEEEEKEEAQQEDSYGYDEDYWYDAHHDFFARAWGYDFDDEDAYEDYYDNWHEAASAREHQRREERKHGYDWRDHKASARDEKCMFCGVNKPITKKEAKANGLNWKEYSAHPEGYKTCWICKDNHVSVMTKSMACKKFGKKLDYTTTRRNTGNEYCPAFWFLKSNGRSFHHQPVTRFYDGPTLNSEYYWYPDLEMEALSLGWKPRGKKKGEVPWCRKDVDSRAVASYDDKKPSATPKKRKSKGAVIKTAVVTPEKKQKRR